MVAIITGRVPRYTQSLHRPRTVTTGPSQAHYLETDGGQFCHGPRDTNPSRDTCRSYRAKKKNSAWDLYAPKNECISAAWAEQLQYIRIQLGQSQRHPTAQHGCFQTKMMGTPCIENSCPIPTRRVQG